MTRFSRLTSFTRHINRVCLCFNPMIMKPTTPMGLMLLMKLKYIFFLLETIVQEVELQNENNYLRAKVCVSAYLSVCLSLSLSLSKVNFDDKIIVFWCR